MSKLTQEKVDALKQVHGEIFELDTVEGATIYVRRPRRPEFQRFQDQIMDESKRGRAAEMLIKAVTVHPDLAGLEAMFDERPGLINTFGEVVLDIAGSTRDAIAKKC